MNMIMYSPSENELRNLIKYTAFHLNLLDISSCDSFCLLSSILISNNFCYFVKSQTWKFLQCLMFFNVGLELSTLLINIPDGGLDLGNHHKIHLRSIKTFYTQIRLHIFSISIYSRVRYNDRFLIIKQLFINVCYLCAPF